MIDSSIQQLDSVFAEQQLLDVTQQGHATQNPVIWILIGFQIHACDVR